jgi:hypothetical protein
MEEGGNAKNEERKEKHNLGLSHLCDGVANQKNNNQGTLFFSLKYAFILQPFNPCFCIFVLPIA